MDIRQLRCFLATIDEGSLSAAAVKLQLAQPSLSQHVARLEEELGTQLLVRTPRGITPTDAGQALAGHARTILEAIADDPKQRRVRCDIDVALLSVHIDSDFHGRPPFHMCRSSGAFGECTAAGQCCRRQWSSLPGSADCAGMLREKRRILNGSSLFFADRACGGEVRQIAFGASSERKMR